MRRRRRNKVGPKSPSQTPPCRFPAAGSSSRTLRLPPGMANPRRQQRMPTQELGMSLPRQPVPAPVKECSCVLFGRAPDTTATTTLFFSKPKMTVSGFPSQVTSATVTLTANLRLGYLCTPRHSENGSDEEYFKEFHVKTLRSRSPQFQGSSRGQAISLITLYWGV